MGRFASTEGWIGENDVYPIAEGRCFMRCRLLIQKKVITLGQEKPVNSCLVSLKFLGNLSKKVSAVKMEFFA